MKNESENVLSDAVLKALRAAVARLEYGTISLKVHDGKVTQMEITEKKRFDEPRGFDKGDGI